MDSGYMTQIRERILSAEDGTTFATSDFADITDSETVRQSLNRLVQAGILRRVLREIFEKPKYSSVLNEFVEVNPDAVAKTLARTYHWTIAPYGIEPMNGIQLGLSLSTGQIKNSFRDALTKEEHNQIFDTDEKEVIKCLITKLLSRC